ncbi:MAG TPA: hypothetical protein PKH64_03285 [Petrotogaceae bacterium]|jgi:uncharacterized membrane protein|nr:hypothetical protein [Petrotogaceae bacterium]HNY37103.1 hypothetical protein [Petrotogaceae bacterium]HOG33865.1 hypothetical protein [Petrotogaceae bacterium]HPX15380.1 hypothetical protein [Petrotogaceae bacterium]HQC40505.1 hypothetical protein [Petrotogaceae bacterium]
MMEIINVVYYIIVAVLAVFLFKNLFKEKNLQKELMYVLTILPFLLRLFRFK